MEQDYVIALGTFDGIHKGHTAVLKKATEFSGVKKAVITFSEPPRKTLQSKNIPLLMTTENKTETLKLLGFDEIIYLDFSAIKDLSPDEFLSLIFEEFPVKAICAGYNYRFGKNGEGNAETLQKFCKENGAECFIADKQTENGVAVSSSQIRDYIKNGEVEKANAMLGHNFFFKSEVVSGDKRGRVMGFPTINQIIPKTVVLPKFGVYATYVTVDNKCYKGITNIGVRPTFKKTTVLCETNILDFKGDLYGKTVTVELVAFVRPEKIFESEKQLISQIATDKNKVKSIL